MTAMLYLETHRVMTLRDHQAYGWPEHKHPLLPARPARGNLSFVTLCSVSVFEAKERTATHCPREPSPPDHSQDQSMMIHIASKAERRRAGPGG